MTLTHHLTSRQLSELEKELRRERARLERSIETRPAINGASPSERPERDADGASEDRLIGALETRMLSRYEQLVAALERLDDGTYGMCQSCGDPIPYGRLLVVPDATFCVRCSA